jgi:hydrogenase-1 operon protein HyaF
MKPFSIPVVALGAGSQVEAETLNYLTLPGGMHTYRPPVLPEADEMGDTRSARSLLERVMDGLAGYRNDAGHRSFDLASLTASDRRLIDQVLGEGEVSARVDVAAGGILIQESVFAGVWRVHQLDADNHTISDRIEVGDIPKALLPIHTHGLRNTPPTPVADPGPGVINAPALLAEIVDKVVQEQGALDDAHVINLSLLPFSPEDGAWLDAVLGRGGISILSRGYGNCRITATGMARVWWVQFFNSQDALILNTIEVTDMPAVARAADEDIIDSQERLAEVLEWLK